MLMMVLPPRFELGLSELEALCAIHYTTGGETGTTLKLGSAKGHANDALVWDVPTIIKYYDGEMEPEV